MNKVSLSLWSGQRTNDQTRQSCWRRVSDVSFSSLKSETFWKLYLCFRTFWIAMQECRCSRSQRIPCSAATGPITIEGSTTLAVGDENNKLQMLFLDLQFWFCDEPKWPQEKKFSTKNMWFCGQLVLATRRLDKRVRLNFFVNIM